MRSVRASSKNLTAGPIDFSLFTDGLRAEREQGITIDVAYRYFATARRKFILADTPGHEQYTRNMATGASTADLAILLVDATNGVRDQTRRHARIARLLGITTFVLAVNKIDLVGFDEGVFRAICDELARRARRRARPGDSAERAARRQRHHVERSHALVYRSGAPALPGVGRRGAVARARPVPLSRAARGPARCRSSADTRGRLRRAPSRSATASRPGRPA